jgi:hypothetical protein
VDLFRHWPPTRVSPAPVIDPLKKMKIGGNHASLGHVLPAVAMEHSEAELWRGA